MVAYEVFSYGMARNKYVHSYALVHNSRHEGVPN